MRMNLGRNDADAILRAKALGVRLGRTKVAVIKSSGLNIFCPSYRDAIGFKKSQPKAEVTIVSSFEKEATA